jgi:3-oxoacyl-[acyl-carrier protein] reductase
MISGYRGLAESFCESFREAGFELSVLVRRAEAIPVLEQRFPGAALTLGDVVSAGDCQRWVERTRTHFGSIDVLINNAGIPGPGGMLHEISMEDFDATLQTNLVAPARLSQLVLPDFLAQGHGVILNLSGGGATAPRPRFSAYAASKCALVRLTETLALEYPALFFYALSPGALRTPMMQAMVEMGPEKIGKEYYDAKRRMEEGGEDPKRAAELALWLVKHHPPELNGKLISAIYDDYRREQPKAATWWTLRRVDEVCRKDLGLA